MPKAQAPAHPVIRLLRLHQPVGIWLLMWPCWWAVGLASNGMPSPPVLLLFALGAACMRAAGCIINDLTDRKFDAKVERTRSRPLVSGEIAVPAAMALLLALLAASLGIALLLGGKVLAWSLLAIPLVVAYPWMKRITWWPQAFLGLTFNWGALVGWVAVRGEVELPACALYAAGFFWTLGYDTIYAHQDKHDDALIGVKSSALYLGEKTKPALWVFYGCSLGLLALAGFFMHKDGLYYAILLLVAADFVCQIRTLDINNSAHAASIFKQNARTGGIVFLACWLG